MPVPLRCAHAQLPRSSPRGICAAPRACALLAAGRCSPGSSVRDRGRPGLPAGERPRRWLDFVLSTGGAALPAAPRRDGRARSAATAATSDSAPLGQPRGAARGRRGFGREGAGSARESPSYESRRESGDARGASAFPTTVLAEAPTASPPTWHARERRGLPREGGPGSTAAAPALRGRADVPRRHVPREGLPPALPQLWVALRWLLPSQRRGASRPPGLGGCGKRRFRLSERGGQGFPWRPPPVSPGAACAARSPHAQPHVGGRGEPGGRGGGRGCRAARRVGGRGLAGRRGLLCPALRRARRGERLPRRLGREALAPESPCAPSEYGPAVRGKAGEQRAPARGGR